MTEIEPLVLSKEINSEEKHRFVLEVNKINDQVFEYDETNSKTTPIIVEKSDVINKRVDEVLEVLGAGQGLLLAGKSNAINKLITIVEIVKSIRNNDENGIHQYNKLLQQSSVSNPNYNNSKMTSKQRKNLVNDLNPKTYLLPILLIYVSSTPLPLEDWTSQ